MKVLKFMLTKMTELSPAAQAVLNAADDVYWDWSGMSPATSRVIAAAALRAAVDQVLPVEYDLVDGYLQYEKQNSIREAFLAIAAELQQFN
jgi:hypothetical protein